LYSVRRVIPCFFVEVTSLSDILLALENE